ncbi:hypothetical protein [Thalassotalea agariperforans]
MKLTNIVVVSALVAMVSACKMTAEDRTIQLTPTNTSATYVYKKLPGDGVSVTTKENIRTLLESHIRQYAGYGNCGFRLCSRGGLESWGTEVASTEENILLTYVNQENYSTGNVYKTTLATALPYVLTENDSTITVSMKPASKVELKQGMGPFVPISPLLSDAKLAVLLERIIKAPAPLLRQDIVKSGEFNVDFDPASVQTNFERKFRYRENDNNGQHDRTYKNNFSLHLNGVNAKVSLNVFLYRGKSKVEYRISYPVRVQGNGDSNFREDFSSRIIQELKDVANS